MPLELYELSAKQREILDREQNILDAAHAILLDPGLSALSMASIAERSNCPRGTIYQHFASKEDILVTLACRSWEKRLGLMQRAVAYDGPSRVRMTAIGEAVTLFFLLYPDEFSILYRAVGSVCEKASLARLEALQHAQRATAGLVRSLLEDAVRDGDLSTEGFNLDEIVMALYTLVEGNFVLDHLGFTRNMTGVDEPVESVWWAFNMLSDAYAWKPLSHEIDWDDALVDIRKSVFPEEAKRAYGEGAWYGHFGAQRPVRNRSGAPLLHLLGAFPGNPHGKTAITES